MAPHDLVASADPSVYRVHPETPTRVAMKTHDGAYWLDLALHRILPDSAVEDWIVLVPQPS